MRILLSFSVLVVLCSFSLPASSDILVPGGDLDSQDILATEPLFGIRNFPRKFIIVDNKTEGKAGIPTAVVDAAVDRLEASGFRLKELPHNWRLYSDKERLFVLDKALAANEVKIDFEFVRTNQPDHLSSKELGAKAPFSEIGDLKGKKILLPVRYSALGEITALGDGFEPVDALFLAGLMRSELIAQPVSVVPTEILNGSVDVVRLNVGVVQDFRTAYDIAEILPQFQVQFIPEQFVRMRRSLEKHPEIAKIALKILPNISFGKPQVYPAEEKELNVAESARRYHDIYWAEFAISNRNLDEDLVESLTFAVTLKGDSIAVDLVPLVYGPIETREEMLSAPETEISVGPAKLRLGEAFRQTVVFESIRPQIRANGLFESYFSWRLQGSAAKPGTSRFVAILKVPKSLKWLELKMSAMAKTRTLLGLHSNLATTKDISTSVRLR